MATNQLIYGFGRPDFLTEETSTLASKFLYVEPLSIEISGNANRLQSKKQVEGIKVVAGSKLVEEEYTAKITIEATSWMALQLAYGELAQTSTNVEIPDVRRATVALNGAAGEIVDADISATTPIWVFDIDGDKPLTEITTGTPTINQFKVVGASNKIEFSPLRVGEKLAYRIVQTIPSIESIGYEEVPTVLDRFGFTALAKGDAGDFKLVVPLMSRISVPTLNLGDVTTLEIEYDCLVKPGQRRAYQLFKL
jgi:hypothetical protein